MRDPPSTVGSKTWCATPGRLIVSRNAGPRPELVSALGDGSGRNEADNAGKASRAAARGGLLAPAADIIPPQTLEDGGGEKHVAEGGDEKKTEDERRCDQLEEHREDPAAWWSVAASEFAECRSASACAACRA